MFPLVVPIVPIVEALSCSPITQWVTAYMAFSGLAWLSRPLTSKTGFEFI